MSSKEAHVEVAGRSVRISSPDKVYYPDSDITKLDLASYYAAVADCVFRALADRPVALNRFPDGLGGSSFYMKHAPKGLPDWVPTIRMNCASTSTRSRAPDSPKRWKRRTRRRRCSTNSA